MSTTEDWASEAVDSWQHAGLDCIIRDSKIGFYNGYVRLPDTHPLHGSTYDQLNRAVSVHGGLTYGGGQGWYGFDTGHSGDYWPGQDSKYAHSSYFRFTTWSMTLLRAEVDSLADQLATLTTLPDPESSYDCTADEFDALLRDARLWRTHVANGGAR